MIGLGEAGVFEAGDRDVPVPVRQIDEFIRQARDDGLGAERVGSLCRLAVELAAGELEEGLEASELAELGLPSLPDAVRELHGPTGVESFRAAARRVALDSVLVLQSRLADRRRRRSRKRSPPARVPAR